MQLLTPSEEQLMLIIWQKDGCYSRDIMEMYPEPKPHQNTVSTFLKILAEKGFLHAEKQGRISKYHASISKENYRLHLLEKLIADYYGNSGSELYKTMQNNKLISKDQKENPIADYLSELTEEKKGKNKKAKRRKHK